MSSFQQKYKAKPFSFGNVKESKCIRATKQKESRKNQRAEAFNKPRNISNVEASISENEEVKLSEVKNRMTRLMKWKTEREKHKKLEQMKKKPAFVVGIVHHKIYSPINNDFVKAPPKKVSKKDISIVPISLPKKVTEKSTINKTLSKNLVKASVKNSNIVLNKEKKIQKKQEECIALNNHKFKPPIGLPQVLLFGKVPVKDTSPNEVTEIMSPSLRTRRTSRKSNNAEFIVKKVNDDSNIQNNNMHIKNSNTFNSSVTKASSSLNYSTPVMTSSDSSSEPVFFSPYIVSSRGKSNARKEQQLRRGFSLSRSSSSDIPTKDTIMNSLNISVEEEERTAQYFQFLLNKEIDRLNELCEKWIEIKEKPGLTEDAQYQIHQTIGQTNLLISNKFERFRRLVYDCETGKGEMLVTCKDLQGFWDMMYMEIRNCDLRFEMLEKLNSQNWEEEKLPVSRSINKRKTVIRKKVVPKKSNSVRTFLMEKRKQMPQKLENEELKTISNHILNDKLKKNANSPNVECKARRSIQACFNNKKSISAKHKGTKDSLLQEVQLSETTKMSSPFTIMKISQMCKTPQVQLDNSISYINSDQTPGKSILKQPKNSLEAYSCIKTTHKVNFDDHIHLNEIPLDEEAQVKCDLASALARIDSLDFDQLSEEVSIIAGKKLTFDDSIEESEDLHDTQQHSKNESTIKIPSTTMQNTTPNEKAPLPRRSLRRQNAVEESNKKSDESSSYNDTNPIPFKEITKIDLQNTIDNMNLNENNCKRRYRTRSVKFSDKECDTYVESKPVLPMTPHIRRNKTRSSENKRKSIFKEELVSWKTPDKLPERIRRSQNRKVQSSG